MLLVFSKGFLLYKILLVVDVGKASLTMATRPMQGKNAAALLLRQKQQQQQQQGYLLGNNNGDDDDDDDDDDDHDEEDNDDEKMDDEEEKEENDEDDDNNNNNNNNVNNPDDVMDEEDVDNDLKNNKIEKNNRTIQSANTTTTKSNTIPYFINKKLLYDWRLADTANQLVDNRKAFFPNDPETCRGIDGTTNPSNKKTKGSTKGGGKTSKKTGASNTVDSLVLDASDEFPIQASLNLLRRQKRDIVHATFSQAAATLVRAFLKKQQQQQLGTLNGAQEISNDDDDDDNDASSDPNDEDHDDDDKRNNPLDALTRNLPDLLIDKQKIASVRQASFLRSLDNKEWAKKKVVRLAVPATSNTETASNKKKTKKSNDSNEQSTSTRQKQNKQQQQPQPDNASSSSSSPSLPLGTDNNNNNNANVPAKDNASSGPKFTRNTPASSAAALDHRFTNSRAILCAAGNLVWAALTANLSSSSSGDKSKYHHHPLEPNNVPQKIKPNVNLGAVLVDANVYAQRTIAMNNSAVRRAELRFLYRQENARYNSNFYSLGWRNQRAINKNTSTDDDDEAEEDKFFLKLPNLFSWRGSERGDYDENNDNNDNGGNSDDALFSEVPWKEFNFEEDQVLSYDPNPSSLTEAWEDFCLPRLLDILKIGSGHALYHDLQWYSRHGRLAHFLKSLKRNSVDGFRSFNQETLQQQQQQQPSFGPHLIVTTQPDVKKFAQEFHDMRGHIPIVVDRHEEQDNPLRVLVYEGTKAERQRCRKLFSRASGLPEAPFHVIVVSYTCLLEDYLHFCQVPFEVVLLDEGASWMAASYGDPNSSLATVWEQGIWCRRQHAGVAGCGYSTNNAGGNFDPWDFSLDVISEAAIKEACLGLTARHRILTAPHLVAESTRSAVELLPISGVVSFLAPIFASVVQEEWDRSNIAKDADSMQHFRKLVARSMVIHHESSPLRDMYELAVLGLEGQLGFTERFGDPTTPEFISDDDFVATNKVTFSRRGCLSWLGTKSVDWLRYELGSSNFEPILDAMKISTKQGHFCEEITTASSTTSSGATGQVGGTMAYRLAMCCLRHFGSEQGLRQHISAQHAPPGTWLCRTCGNDCITSQARTYHERTCGQPTTAVVGDPTGAVGANPTVGQGGSKAGVGKKKSQRITTTQQGGLSKEEKDPDGSLRVPGYRGVWVNKEGKHFIKVNKERYTGDGDELVFFDSADAAARSYDDVISRDSGENKAAELNFKADGTRNIYEDATSSTASGLGGSAANVVPLLSVINIKDLPPDVKPLLRDPRQTSRTGGNSKRHVYAYRGVCRQARKGHDRWQSQISFMGVNHYLGTFDSEWDAAAIYSWAHLILYGEEATKQAQKEGEEAAEAYEQEKRDIAAGKIPAGPAKAEKAKKPKQPRKKLDPKPGKKRKSEETKSDSGEKNEDSTEPGQKKRKIKLKVKLTAEKKPKTDTKNAKHEKESMNATLALGASKTLILGERAAFHGMSNTDLETMVSSRLRSVRENLYRCSVVEKGPTTSPAMECLRPCLPVQEWNQPLGAAMLVSLSPFDPGWHWNLGDFVEETVASALAQNNSSLRNDSSLATAVKEILKREYDPDGTDAARSFQSVMIQGSLCVIGQANKRMSRQFQDLVGIPIPPGSTVGDIDCHIGSTYSGICSNRAACIRYNYGLNEFQFSCLCNQTIVTWNGQRIMPGTEWVVLQHNDVCSVGSRTFVFVLPK